MTSRLERLREKLREKELDLLFVSAPENREYLSGFTGSAGYLLITRKEALIATDFRYFEQARLQARQFQLVEVWGGLEGWLPKVLTDLSPRRVGFEAAHLTFATYRQVVDIAAKLGEQHPVEFMPTYDLVEELRATKEPEEVQAIQRTIDLADAAFNTVAESIRPGMTEREAAWMLEKAMRERGAEAVSFETIVAAGPNGAMAHHHPSDHPIQAGGPVVIDFGARYNGYCSDCTRTICLGHPDDTFARVYDIVLGAQLTAIATIAAGMDGAQGDRLARTVIEQAGYGDNFGHGLGHGVGLAVHEAPWVRRNSTSPLAEGMVFTIEPGIYIPGWGGVRIEDMVLLENGRARVLTKSVKLGELGRV